MDRNWTDSGGSPRHPGDVVRSEILDKRGLSVTKLACILGVGRRTLAEMLDGRHRLTADMAVRIERTFRLDMAGLLDLQARCDADRARER